MSDPYKVLGVSPDATDDEVKSAYRELAKKYHPDNYDQSPLSDLAAEKMKEVNEAYDTIVAERKNRKYGPAQPNGYQANYRRNSNYGDVRSLLMNGRIADAEQILNGVPTTSRDAEWYFLKGTVLYKKGWMEEAYSHFTTACNMDPGNGEYRAAMNQIQNQRSGAYGGYNPARPATGGCNACDMCSSLICADCCCECFGGDLIPCC
jgi:molecular chaperone DnaJ